MTRCAPSYAIALLMRFHLLMLLLSHGRYPNNPVLKILTPRDTCRNLQIYPVKLTQVSISDEARRACPLTVAHIACETETDVRVWNSHMHWLTLLANSC